MTYTRYIYKKGKKLGPYSYKNIRDEDGKVKSIYLGKVTGRGKRPLEATIVFLVILLIVISALFFVQNRSLVLSKKAVEEAKVPFEVDQILMKVLIKTGEHLEKDIRIMNVDDEEKTIEIGVSGLYDIVDFDKEFKLKPGQTKIARFNFSSFNKEYRVEKVPGVYVGKIVVKTDSYERGIPLIVEIESKNVLFDMNLNPIARDRSILKGESKTIEVRLFNLQSIKSFNVDMEYFVKDLNENTIISEKENVVIKTQASFFKTIKIPESLKTGNYVFIAEASFGDSVGTASYLFEVEDAKESKSIGFIGFCRNDPLCWVLSIVILLLIFTLGAYLYFFIGAFIYKKMFGKQPKAKKVRVTKPEIAREKVKKEARKKREGKSRNFIKCHKLLLKANEALEELDVNKAMSLYAKGRDLYLKLEYMEKKELYNEFMKLYNELSK